MPQAEPAVCVVLHDVAPATWPNCQRILDQLDALGPIPVTLLIVPEYHYGQPIDRAPHFSRAIEQRIARGDETLLHGLYHLDAPQSRAYGAFDGLKRRVYTAGEGEFSDLQQTVARQRMERGLERFDQLGWKTYGFVAPAWLMSPGTRAALAHFSFRYTSTRKRLYKLPGWQPYGTPSLVWSVRTLWRRRLSGIYNRGLNHRLREAPLLRLGLHPVDAIYPQAMRFWIETLKSALQTRTPMTKAAWLGVTP